jgi:hypothetical protein
VFVIVSHIHPSLMFEGMARSLPLEWSMDNEPHLGMFELRIGWKLLTVTNTLAYYATQLITVVNVLL